MAAGTGTGTDWGENGSEDCRTVIRNEASRRTQRGTVTRTAKRVAGMRTRTGTGTDWDEDKDSNGGGNRVNEQGHRGAVTRTAKAVVAGTRTVTGWQGLRQDCS